MGKITVNEAWRKLLEKYNILHKIEVNGSYIIAAKDIKEFKEPRLMTKWDSSEVLPQVLKQNNINMLPISRSAYIMGKFKLYEPLPALNESVVDMTRFKVPEYESLDINFINSESNAINVLLLSRILDDFLEEEDNVETFNGRMGTGQFSFVVNGIDDKSYKVDVDRAQLEIDGGLENEHSVVIIEAKNVVYSDFHIRQLYYPFRLWSKKVNKPIRLVFSQYTNQIFRLFEYTFEDENDYSSIKLVRVKNYTFQDIEITAEDLLNTFNNTKIQYDDYYHEGVTGAVPFIQADSFERLISLCELLYDKPLSPDDIAEVMNFDRRQSDYYFNAGRYLGLCEREPSSEIKHGKQYNLTSLGRSVFSLNYKERNLKLVELILQHKIFHILYKEAEENGVIPDSARVRALMEELHVCSASVSQRRSSSVIGWLKWIYSLPKITFSD